MTRRTSPQSAIKRATSRHISRGAGVGFALAMLVALTAAGQGQTVTAAQTGAGGDSAQAARPDYRFEVASIRPSDGPTSDKPGHMPGPAYTPGRYREENVSMAGLAFTAFNIRHGYQIEWPSWMGATYFTVEAKLPEGAAKTDVPMMMQHLLEDRFSLKFHRETRHVAGYELVVVKSGAKMEKGVAPDPNQPKVSPYEFGKDGSMHFAKGARSGFMIGPGGGACCTAQWLETNMNMKQLAAALVDKVSAPVTDATGLEGTYGFTLVYTPEPSAGSVAVMMGPVPAVAAATATGGGGAAAPMDHPLLRDALQEQLGLKLQPVKDVSIDVVVVDSANNAPTEN